MNRQNALLIALGLVFLAGTGCSTSSFGTSGPYSGGPSDWVASGWRSHVWANRAYETTVVQAGHHCRFEGDYKRGFVAGYQAVCDGGDGEIPAVPPRRYWGSRYLSPEGQSKSPAWFEGYPAGVRAAQSDGIDSYRDIYVSQLLDDVNNLQNGNQPAVGEHMNGVDMIAPEAIQPIPASTSEGLGVPPEPSASDTKPSINQAFQSLTSMWKKDAS